MYTLLYSKWITDKDLLYSTWNSTQCYVSALMGGGLRSTVALGSARGPPSVRWDPNPAHLGPWAGLELLRPHRASYWSTKHALEAHFRQDVGHEQVDSSEHSV